MVDNSQVARSKGIQRRTGKTFHVATRVLPRRVRHPTYVLYAFFRLADEVVDDADGAAPAEQRDRLERMRAAALGEAKTDDAVLSAFSELRAEFGIRDDDVHAFVDAMVADIGKDRYATYGELESYMDGSAAAVGRMMTALMDPESPERALPRATALGKAFQMTNFLRDVREDVVERGRIYLPRSTRRHHGVTDEQIESLRADERFAAAIRAELRRTEALYAEGVGGIEYLPADCQFAVLLSAVLYADHHRLIRARDCDVLSSTPTLSTRRKLSLLARTRWRWAWNDDPETVFYRVSALAPDDTSPAGAERPDQLPAR